jgi:hypothetical protein
MNIDFYKSLVKVYPSVVRASGDIAYDIDNNEVNYDSILVNAEIAKTAYIAQRVAEYPSFAEQFDLLYHGGYDAWKATIDAVKTKYPKGE